MWLNRTLYKKIRWNIRNQGLQTAFKPHDANSMSKLFITAICRIVWDYRRIRHKTCRLDITIFLVAQMALHHIYKGSYRIVLKVNVSLFSLNVYKYKCLNIPVYKIFHHKIFRYSRIIYIILCIYYYLCIHLYYAYLWYIHLHITDISTSLKIFIMNSFLFLQCSSH